MEECIRSNLRYQIIMYSTTTQTYTVTDIRKTFESLDADIRTIARRTKKWSIDTVDSIMHDVLALAEAGYLSTIDITLLDAGKKAIRATRYTINQNGVKSSGDKAGQNNDWADLPDTELVAILSYTSTWRAKTQEQKAKFQKENDFKISWVPSSVNTSYPNLRSSSAQIYASNGYELNKCNYQ